MLILSASQSLAKSGDYDFPVSGPPLSEPEEPTAADNTHELLTRKVGETARWVDSFFDDPNYQAEDATSRLRLRNELRLTQKDNPKFKVKINLKLHLPRLSRKAKENISLVVGGQDSLDDSDDATGSIDSAVNDATDKPVFGLQFFMLDQEKWNASLTSGVKVSGPALFVGPRVRYSTALNDDSMVRVIQTTRWFTDDGWDLRLRMDYDRLLSEQYFFRQTVDTRWRESRRDEDGYRVQFTSAFTQALSGKIAVSYQWISIFKSRPRQRVDSTTFQAQYRRRFWRKWLFYEVVPQLAFQDEHDWQINPGVTLRLEVVLGNFRKKRK